MGRGSEKEVRPRMYASLKTTKQISEKEKILAPRFLIQKKNPTTTKWVFDGEETEMSGQVFMLSTDSYVYEGDTIWSVRIGIFDTNKAGVTEEFILEIPVDSFLGRKIINKLLGTVKLGWLNIRVYVTKANEQGEQFADCFMTNDEEKMAWLYDHNDIKGYITEYFDGKKDRKSYVKVNELFLANWKLHIESFNAWQAEIRKDSHERNKVENATPPKEDLPPLREQTPPPAPQQQAPPPHITPSMEQGDFLPPPGSSQQGRNFNPFLDKLEKQRGDDSPPPISIDQEPPGGDDLPF